jgi:hypothetical protein
MSKYAEIRELLKEDIHTLVEAELYNRMTNLIPALMPAILEFVANSITVYTTDVTPNIQEISVNLEYVDPVSHLHTSRNIRTQKVLNPQTTFGRIQHVIAAYDNLEIKVNSVIQTLNNITPDESPI